MTDLRDSFEPTDEPDDPAADATLDQAIRHLRSMSTPPVPVDLFAGVPPEANVAPTSRDRRTNDLGEPDRRRRRIFILAVASLAAAILVAVGIGFALARFGSVNDEERDVAQSDPSQETRDVSTQIAVEPHPRLRTLADETAELKERVRSLRHRAQATAARRQAERLLRQYAGR